MYLGVRNRALYTMYTNWIGGKVLHSGPVLVLMLRGPLAHAAYSTRAVVILLHCSYPTVPQSLFTLWGSR